MNLDRTAKVLHRKSDGRRGMDTAHRRMEIISILSAKGHMTMRELAWELDVSRRKIMNDIILTIILFFLDVCFFRS